jgi:hypothetical protein
VDTLRALEHLSNVLTVDEWQRFKSTDEYLWMVARTERYRGPAMEELVRKGTKRREEAWAIALDMARSIIEQDLREVSADVPEEARRAAIKGLAEKLLVEQDIVPPTYTAWCDCVQCGRVPVPEESDEVMAACPWCNK